MRILFVSTYFHGGGAEKAMRQLYYGIKDENIETYCMVGRIQRNVPDDVEVIYHDFIGRCVTTLAGGLFNNTLFRTGRAKKKIIEFIKEKNINIVHFHNLHSNYIGISDLAEIRKYCDRIVITLHDMWMLTGECAYSFECTKWHSDNYCRNCGGNDNLHKRKFLAPSILNYKKKYFGDKGFYFVAPSGWICRCVKESYLQAENIRVINNGISLNNFVCHQKSMVRKKYHLPEDKHILMFAANSIQNVYKGFQYLLDALQRIPDKDRYVLLTVGNAAQEESELSYECYNMGYIQDESVLCEIYAAADLFIMPSVADNFPYTAMEPMASGTPVLAFETGGIPEIVTESVGWLVPARNSEALADKITDIFLHPDELESKTSMCRKYVEDRYSEAKMMKHYRDLYEEILE